MRGCVRVWTVLTVSMLFECLTATEGTDSMASGYFVRSCQFLFSFLNLSIVICWIMYSLLWVLSVLKWHVCSDVRHLNLLLSYHVHDERLCVQFLTVSMLFECQPRKVLQIAS